MWNGVDPRIVVALAGPKNARQVYQPCAGRPESSMNTRGNYMGTFYGRVGDQSFFGEVCYLRHIGCGHGRGWTGRFEAMGVGSFFSGSFGGALDFGAAHPQATASWSAGAASAAPAGRAPRKGLSRARERLAPTFVWEGRKSVAARSPARRSCWVWWKGDGTVLMGVGKVSSKREA